MIDPPVVRRRWILFLDEASSSLDSVSEYVIQRELTFAEVEHSQAIQEVLRQEFSQKGTTVIVVAHRISYVTFEAL